MKDIEESREEKQEGYQKEKEEIREEMKKKADRLMKGKGDSGEMDETESPEDQEDLEEIDLHRTKPGSTRKFLFSAAVIAGLLALIGIGFFSGIRYQKLILSGDNDVSVNKSYEMYFQEGKSFQQDEDYEEALRSYNRIDESFASYDKVKENIELCSVYYSVDRLTQAQVLLGQNKTEDAIEVLCGSLQVLGDNDDIKNAIKKISAAKDKKKVELDLPEGKEKYLK